MLQLQEYRNLPGVLQVEARDMRAVVKSSKFVKIKKKEFQGRSTVSLRGAKEELLTLGNTWYLIHFLYLRSKPPMVGALMLKLKLKLSFQIYAMRCSGGCQFKTEMVK